jgi:tetratricopeptide (TPR) repeat protein
MGRKLHARGIPEASRDVIDASVFLAEVLRMSGEPSLAIGVLDEAALFQPDDRQRARMERQRGLVAQLFGDLEAAIHHLHASIGRAIRGGDPDFLCQAYLDLARLLEQTSDGAKAIAELQQAIDVITLGQGLSAVSAPAGLWRIAIALAERQLARGDMQRARSTAIAALSHARRIGYPHARGRVSALLAQICEAQGDYQNALAFRANAIEEMRQLGDRRSTAELLIASANASAERERDPKLARWSVSPRDAIRLARELAEEIGWELTET